MVEAFRVCWVCDCAPELVRVADPTRFASTVLVDPCFEPPITRVVPEHLGQDW